MKKNNILVASIVTAFSSQTVGTKVVDKDRFMALLAEAVQGHDFSKDKVPGQGFIPMSKDSLSTVASGVGKRTQNPDDYVVRLYRGSVTMFLRREKAAPAESVNAIVYTMEAYLQDPEVLKDTKESERVKSSGCTHVLVSVLSSAGPKPQLSFERFTKNLAGNNREFDPAQGCTLEKVIQTAKVVVEYGDTWCTVAD